MAKKRDAVIQISRKRLFLWSTLILFISCWMFVLGIMVGRGFAPMDVEDGNLDREIAANQAQAKVAAHTGSKGANPPELGFFDVLKENQTRQKIKRLPKKKRKPVRPPAPAKPAKSVKPAPPAKPTPKKQPAAVAKPPVKAAPAAKPTPSKDHFTIQVAAVKIIANAEKLVGDLRKKGYPAYQVRVAVPGKGEWYRVRVGAFESRDTASRMLNKLKASKINGMVISTD